MEQATKISTNVNPCFLLQKKFEKCNGTFETFSEEDTLYIRGTLPILGGGVS